MYGLSVRDVDIEEIDRNNYLRLTEKAHYIIETYNVRSPGDCICGHSLPHHSPAAVGRECQRACDCRLFVSSIGVRPWRRVSVVDHDVRSAPRNLNELFRRSLEWQRIKIGRMAQRSIERIYNS